MPINTYNPTVTYINTLTPDVYQVAFELPEGQEVEFEAGQYLIMFIPQADSTTPIRRLYSIASPSYQKGAFDLLIKSLPGGAAGEFVKELSVGDTVMFQGPAGRFTMRENEKSKVFLCTGTGIAPIRSMILTEIQSGLKSDYHLFWGLRTRQDMFLQEEWEILADRDERFHFMMCASREHEAPIKKSVPTRIDLHVREQLTKWKKEGKDLNASDYYICGGIPVIDGFREELAGLGVERENIFFEKFV